MTIEQPHSDGMAAIREAGGFADKRNFTGRESFFNATGKQKMLDDTTARIEILSKYPFPPSSCVTAQATIQMIKDEITSHQQQAATGSSASIQARYIEPLQTVLLQYQAWVSNAQCEKQQEDAATQAFQDQLTGALNNETGTETSKKTVDNWLIYGGLGLLVVTAMVLIIKKS